MELDVVVSAKPIFYKRYVNDMYVRRMKNYVDKLFEELNSYNENITLGVNPTKFLDTEFIIEKGEITTQLFTKSTKLPVHWSSKLPVRYKPNAITGEQNWEKRIVSDFNNELKKTRHGNAGFLLKFINERICNFEREKAEMIISEWLLDERKIFSVRFPYSPANEKFSKVFMRKVETFTNEKVKVIIISNTRKEKYSPYLITKIK